MIEAKRLREHVEALTAHGPRFEDLPGVPAALRYATDQLSAVGLKVRVERYGRELHEVNLVAEIEGGTSDDAVELCAHWDSVETSPGADDNASGVAGVLEAARALRDADLPARTIRFVLFGGEEAQFDGSAAHQAFITEKTESIVFEMIGFTGAAQRLPEELEDYLEAPERGDFIALVADDNSQGLLARFARHLEVPSLPLVLPEFAKEVAMRSDHVPYWEAGRRSLLVTDTADYRNPHYHRPSDTAETLNYDFAAAVVKAAVRTITTIAQ
ncbi:MULTISPECIES: M20/M25/M40 family metallo-hydrolase [Dactylosporangium]|uniref:Peptidase M28 n=2 Tax=Dactylosporangium TaxID=35753 RepID=A0A9W6NL42_9ACTN|nr:MULTISPECIES: M20/M25/M40 family metallo-hydrolase [Dactylosporangium]UAB95696.1 M20/M25/M40 family metallo-hydrolase [Dactylosporangium vinaceum]UWZ44053.1 M20/M25/M40 family metallo-hydrolase [Dactylosporangium matsuzakiense]GLL00746.1 peptidase M28 [Dactylosporangium matsuzakiense]